MLQGEGSMSVMSPNDYDHGSPIADGPADASVKRGRGRPRVRYRGGGEAGTCVKRAAVAKGAVQGGGGRERPVRLMSSGAVAA